MPARGKLLLALALLAVAGIAAWQAEWHLSALEAWIAAHALLGAAIYFVLVAASVVVLPFSSLPLLPIATRSYGVTGAALLSAAGWWVGALLAFQLARLGRRAMERFVSLRAVDEVAGKIPPDIGFGGIVVLRMTLPVDLVSFALGLVKGLGFRTYAAASLVGIVPFAFVLSYAGGELGAGRYLSFAMVVLVAAAVALAGRHAWKSRHGPTRPARHT